MESETEHESLLAVAAIGSSVEVNMECMSVHTRLRKVLAI